MNIFRICLSKYATSLQASGKANRWNKDDEYVIYAGESRALSALELVVHRASFNIKNDFKILSIEIDEDIEIKSIERTQLPDNWKKPEAYIKLQSFGSNWYQSQESVILKVPSIIIEEENNYIINTKHPFFQTKIHLKEIKEFVWDARLL